MNRDNRNKTVFLITIDALRPDHLKSYGYHRNTAPNLEKFAEKGTTFLNAITNGPETPSAFSSLFTSILPFLSGGFSPLPIQKLILPQILKENDVYTYGIHSNPNLGEFFNYHRGFDVFLDGERYKEKQDMPKNQETKKNPLFLLKKILNYKNLFDKLMYGLKGFNKIKSLLRNRFPFLTDIFLPFTPIAYNAPYVVNKVVSFLRKIDKPLFLWAHLMDVHSPFNPPSKNVLNINSSDINLRDRNFLTSEVYQNPEKYRISTDILDKLKILYDAEINYVDSYLKDLFELIPLKFPKDCLVIITADHGESFFEHGFFFHQGNIYDELLKIPFFIIEIGNENAIKTVNNTVQIIDIAPTIIDYFGFPIPDSFQGISLIPLIRGESVERGKYVISETYQKNGIMKRNNKDGYKLISIRSDQWKYIYNEQSKEELLFHLKSDPEEKVNLVIKEEEKLTQFRRIRDSHFEEITTVDELSKISKVISQIDFKKINL
ncbi:MAG: sulfatase-like hydrolase/transferase [Candidatus Lokiarchaeota archaeon]|nr:sulfatase-like hydrolase/transferase [Candidatus Lokiarchaeota archaeon]